jgi:tRNA G37 N-methylase Trm5
LRIFLSPRKKVPVIGANKREYYLWQFPVVVWDYFAIRRWKRRNQLIGKNGDIETYQIGTQKVAFTPHHWSVYFREWNGQWERYYLPNFDLKDKTVLDAGAGSGETILFYLMHGAKHVIAVEPDPVAFSLLKQNSETNNWPVTLFNEPLTRKHLEMQFDFAKLDCEGGETMLFDYLPKAPIALEAHATETIERLGKLGFHISKRLGPGLALMRNW